MLLFGGFKVKNVKRAISLTLAASILFAVCSCDESDNASAEGSLNLKWLDSSLFENVDQMAGADIKDDFAAAVNYEWASTQERNLTYPVSTFGEVRENVVKRKRALIEDESVQGKNIELLRTADGLFCDWEYRDSLGMDPLKKYLAYIDEIQSLDDVSAYMIDNDKNPFAYALVQFTYNTNEAIDEYKVLDIRKPTLILDQDKYYVSISEDGYKKKESVEKKVSYLLERCGYSEKEINDTLTRGLKFESELVLLDYADLADFTSIKNEAEVFALAGDYPLENMLTHYSITECDHFMGEFSYLDKLENVYKQKNVEDMKAYFKVRLALDSILYLDAGAYNCYMDSNLDRSNPYDERIDKDPDFNFFDLLSKTPLTAAIDQVYIDNYFNEDTYNQICEYVHLIKEKYQILINENEYLSEESKKAVCEKLSNMGENIFLPSNTADFTGVELKSREEGGSFLDAMCVLSRIRYEHAGDMVQSPTDKSFWDIYDRDLSTTAINSNYHRRQNTIYLSMGIFEAPVYTPGAPFEVNLGTSATIIGHEISHAFDSNNINRNAEGKQINTLTAEEMQIWSRMSTRIQDHFYGYEPFEGSGAYTAVSLMTGEVIADAEGMRVCLMIAKDQESFDYDLFFRSYAFTWRGLDAKTTQMDAIKNDKHPLFYLRINYTVMQFDEFIETYDLKPGDGMYLAPDQRIIIW